jgi:ADP-ribosylglycohydrolase
MKTNGYITVNYTIYLPMTIKDRIKGMLYGHAIGDSLGYPHEFRTSLPLRDYTGFLEHVPQRIVPHQGYKYGVIGQNTDDSQMTISLAYALIEDGGLVKNHVVSKYMEWANCTSALGINTRKLLKGIKTIRGYEARYVKAMAAGLNTQSNGSLMRCCPLACVSGDDDLITDCNITNPNDVNRECSTVYINVLRMLLNGKGVDVAMGYVKETLSETLGEVLGEVNNLLKRDVTRNKGWVVHAFYCFLLAMKLVNENRSYEETIDVVVRLGGDTDTNAAIAGAVVGAYLGKREMMKEGRTNYNYQALIAHDTREGDHVIPDVYHPRHLEEVGEGLAGLFRG